MDTPIIFRQLLEYETNTYTYIVADKVTKEAIIIDPVLETVERDAQLIKELWLTLRYILDTHVHADHITGSSALKKITGGLIALWIKNEKVVWNDIFLSDGQELHFWSQTVKVLETPWHTSWCVSYLVGDMAFTGDLLFVRGTGRTDFQSGSNQQMYDNIYAKIFTLPQETEIFPGHDYKGHMMTTVGEEIQFNPRVKNGNSFEVFGSIMDNLHLPYPKKLDVSLPANLKSGNI